MTTKTPLAVNVIRGFAIGLYLFAVVLPNILIENYGIVDVAPGGAWTLMAPAAVYAVGLALVARDLVDDLTGSTWLILGLIVIGSIISAIIADPGIALASFVAFLVSEMLDLGIYRALRKAGWTLAALASSYVGAVIDSLIFLWIAFESLDFLEGQWVGKAVSITIVVLVVAPLRALLERRYAGRIEDREPVGA